jgi:hypothetical protein
MLEGSGFGPGLPGYLFYKGTFSGPLALFEIELLISTQLLDIKTEGNGQTLPMWQECKLKLQALPRHIQRPFWANFRFP